MDENRIEEMSQDEKNWGMFCHLAALAGFIIPLGNLVGPLVVWLIKKDQYGFADYNGKESLNFQITVLIAMLVSLLLTLIVIGFILMAAVGVFALVVTILAIVKSSKGEYYKYPCCLRLIK